MSKRLGLPLVFGELLAGVLLGPTLLNIWGIPWFASLQAPTGLLAQIGVVVLMFLAGLETDVEAMKGAVGPACWAASGGVALPLGGGCALARAAGLGWPEAIFIGTILAATSVSITAQTLMELNQLGTRAGSTILGAAVIDDLLGLVVLSLVMAAVGPSAHFQGSGWRDAGLALVRMAGFLVFMFWPGKYLLRLVFTRARPFRESNTPPAAALGIAFLFAFLAAWAGGMAAVTGSYLAGLFLAATPAHAQVKEDVRSLTTAFFGPLFFSSLGLEINAGEVAGHFGFFLLMVLVAVLGKVAGAGLGARWKGLGGSESLFVGVGMIPRGEIGLITAGIGRAAGLVSSETYSLMVVVVLATTLAAPVLLRGFAGEALPVPVTREPKPFLLHRFRRDKSLFPG